MFSLARLVLGLSMVFALLPVQPALSQLTDKTQTNSANAGINKSFADEANASLAGDGRGDVFTPGSSLLSSTAIRSARCAAVGRSSSASSRATRAKDRASTTPQAAI